MITYMFIDSLFIHSQVFFNPSSYCPTCFANVYDTVIRYHRLSFLCRHRLGLSVKVHVSHPLGHSGLDLGGANTLDKGLPFSKWILILGTPDRRTTPRCPPFELLVNKRDFDVNVFVFFCSRSISVLYRTSDNGFNHVWGIHCL